MGFLGLFDKKLCAVCGGEIGLLGNRKLADGNLCKNCAAKLSPFMTDRRESTVQEIRQHLAYREQNARALLGFSPTRAFGQGRLRVYVDENQGLFIVTGNRNYINDNPDVIRVDQILALNPSIHDHRTELYHNDREGRRVPYNPPRYRVEYSFQVEMEINSPYFNHIGFEFSGNRPDDPRGELYRALEDELQAMREALEPSNYAPAAPVAPATPAPAAAAQPAPAAADGWQCACGQLNKGNFCTNCGAKRLKVFRCDKCGWTPEDPGKLPNFCPNCGDPFNENDVG